MLTILGSVSSKFAPIQLFKPRKSPFFGRCISIYFFYSSRVIVSSSIHFFMNSNNAILLTLFKSLSGVGGTPLAPGALCQANLPMAQLKSQKLIILPISFAKIFCLAQLACSQSTPTPLFKAFSKHLAAE